MGVKYDPGFNTGVLKVGSMKLILSVMEISVYHYQNYYIYCCIGLIQMSLESLGIKRPLAPINDPLNSLDCIHKTFVLTAQRNLFYR